MDEELKRLLKSVSELGQKLKEDDSYKKKERLKLEREWKLKNQELMNYLRKIESKIRINLRSKGKTEEREKLEEDWRIIFGVLYNSHPNIVQSWNPLSMQRIIEEIYKKAQENELDKK